MEACDPLCALLPAVPRSAGIVPDWPESQGASRSAISQAMDHSQATTARAWNQIDRVALEYTLPIGITDHIDYLPQRSPISFSNVQG
jgi:hypothetical protein